MTGQTGLLLWPTHIQPPRIINALLYLAISPIPPVEMSGTSESLATLEHLRAETNAANEYLIVWSSLLIWDWLATLPAEIEYIWRKKKTPLRIMFLANRYGTLVLNTASVALILTNVPQKICDKMYWIETFCLTYVLLITDALIAFRVFVTYDRSRLCAVILVLLITVELSVLVVAASRVTPLSLPQDVRETTGTIGCIAADPQGEFAVLALAYSFVPFVTNLLLLGAMVFRNWQMTRRLEGVALPILKRMVRDGTLYSVSITLVNTVNIYFYIQPNESIKSFNIPAVVVVSSTLSCRLVLSLFVRKPDSTSRLSVSHASVRRSSANVRASVQLTRMEGEGTETVPPKVEDSDTAGTDRPQAGRGGAE